MLVYWLVTVLVVAPGSLVLGYIIGHRFGWHARDEVQNTVRRRLQHHKIGGL